MSEGSTRQQVKNEDRLFIIVIDQVDPEGSKGGEGCRCVGVCSSIQNAYKLAEFYRKKFPRPHFAVKVTRGEDGGVVDYKFF